MDSIANYRFSGKFPESSTPIFNFSSICGSYRLTHSITVFKAVVPVSFDTAKCTKSWILRRMVRMTVMLRVDVIYSHTGITRLLAVYKFLHG